MAVGKTSRDFLVEANHELTRQEMGWHTPTAISEQARAYSDAELYRIIVVQSIREGRFQSKAEFDNAVRQLGPIEHADQFLAFQKSRPGCRAWRQGQRMMCECGVAWAVDSADPPHCKV